jgi:LysR family transcriptional regulator, positive regulator for ilvC
MDFRTLSLFTHLAHTLHFANTANQMAVSPSTLSRTMQRLEQETGCALFERDNRSVVLTNEGKQLLVFAERWLQEWKDLRDDLRHPREALQGRIRVFCSVTASYFLLPELLGRFRHRYPQLELKLETGDAALAVDKVLQEETDIAIAARPDALPSRLKYCLLQQVPLVFIAPRFSNNVSQWLKEGEPDWSQVPLIFSQQGLARKRCDQWFRNKGISPNIYAEVAGNEAIVSMVALDCGIGIVPEAVIDHSPLGVQVRVIQPAPALKPFEVGLCVQKKRLDEPLIQAFWQMAQQ